MTDKLKQIIKEEVEKLPKEARDAVSSFDWITITEEIGNKFLLEEDDINGVQTEILLVLVGITDLEFYEVNLENKMVFTKDKAKDIAEEVFREIFNPINNILIENIKKSPKSANLDWRKNLQFVLSDGDYSVFLEKNNKSKNNETPKPTTSNNNHKIKDIRSKFTI